jgi:hypothetical protein
VEAAPLNKDQLAAAYLKSRDLPCPSCGYNRRDGQTSVCPECEHDLAIVHEDGGWKEHYSNLAARFLTILMVLISFHILMAAHSTFFWLNQAITGRMPPGMFAYYYLVRAPLELIAYLIVLVLSIRARRAVRDRTPGTPMHAARPLIAYAIISIFFMLSSFLPILF